MTTLQGTDRALRTKLNPRVRGKKLETDTYKRGSDAQVARRRWRYVMNSERECAHMLQWMNALLLLPLLPPPPAIEGSGGACTLPSL